MTDCILEAINSTMQANMSALTGRLCPSISRPQGGGKRRAELRFHGRYPPETNHRSRHEHWLYSATPSIAVFWTTVTRSTSTKYQW